MKTVAQLLLTMTLALAIIAVCVFAAGDRQTLVPPPDAVAEAFVRQAAARRYDRVHALQSWRRRELGIDEAYSARRTSAGISTRCGASREPSTRSRRSSSRSTETDARAVATAYGDLTEARFLFDLLREDGLWKVFNVSTNPMLPPEPPE